MWLQTDPRWTHIPMGTEGCALMCALWHIDKLHQLPHTIPEVERDLFAMIVRHSKLGIESPITPVCYVNSWDRLAREFGVIVSSPADVVPYIKHQSILAGIVGRYRWENHVHYMVCDTDGTILYDPMGDWVYKKRAIARNYRILYWATPSSDYPVED